jgi:hypothetical protein
MYSAGRLAEAQSYFKKANHLRGLSQKTKRIFKMIGIRVSS